MIRLSTTSAMRTGLLLLSCCLCTSSRSQDLVQNGDFELYNACHSGIAFDPGYTQFPCVQAWVRPTTGSSDYYNTCIGVTAQYGVPNNECGYQLPHSGNAYAGIIACSKSITSGTGDLREYLTTRLTRPMKKDSNYCVRLFVAPGIGMTVFGMALPTVGINELGVCFSDTMPAANGYGPLILPYHVINDTTRYLSDTSMWYEISGTYKAHGGEQWMHIGTFNSKAPGYVNIAGGNGSYIFCYYYVDDVSVLPLVQHDSFRNKILCDSAILLSSSLPAGPYNWNTGDTTRSIQVSQSGQYSCEVISGCNVYKEYFNIIPPPQTDSVHDSLIICTTLKSTLDLTAPQPTGYHKWSTGATTRTLQVNGPGSYTCSTLFNCTEFRDIFHVAADNVPVPTLRDTSICQFVAAPMIATQDTSLVWYWQASDDSGLRLQPPIPTTKVETVSIYVARQTDNCISLKVPIQITIKAPPKSHQLQTLLRCNDGTRQYMSIGTQLEPDIRYKWSSGETLCCIVPQTYGRYIRTATNSCGTATDLFELRATSCDSCVIFPNAFSPNDDGINDGFRAIEVCTVKDLRIQLYDRWEKRVFETDEKDGRWDGRLNGADAAPGTYMYYATFTTVLSDKKHIVKGSVILFR